MEEYINIIEKLFEKYISPLEPGRVFNPEKVSILMNYPFYKQITYNFEGVQISYAFLLSNPIHIFKHIKLNNKILIDSQFQTGGIYHI